MRCRKVHGFISRSVDGELEANESVRLERHLETCSECRSLLEDLRRIVGAAAELGTPEPSEKVWRNVRAGLAGGGSKAPVEGITVERRPFFGMGLPAFRFAGAAALAIVLIVSSVVVGLRLGRRTGPSGLEAGERYTLAKLDEAERYYRQAIKSLSEAFTAGRGALAPQVAEVFDRNMAVIDATIQACRRSVLDEPDDLEARNYLMAAYTRKITLLDSALDLQRNDQDGAGRKKTL